MPSVSPGDDSPSTFQQILPGAPVPGFQSTSTLTFRWKRYILSISQHQLNILRSPTELVQGITSEEELVAVIAEVGDQGRIALATREQVWLLKPVTSAWNRVTWEKELCLRRDDEGREDQITSLSWSAEGELLVGGTHVLSLFSTTPASRASSPADEQVPVSSLEQRRPLWSRSIASPLRFARFSPSANLIATSATYGRLVKIWRRLSFEEAIFDYAYLPHEGAITHLEWRSAEPAKLEIGLDVLDRRSVSSYYGGDEHCEVLFTLASDAQLRIWRTNDHHDLDMLSLYTIIDLVSAIPHSPALQTRSASASIRPPRYMFVLPSFLYGAAATTALKKLKGKLRHSMEHVREVSSHDPDIVVAIDGQGRMSAWGVSSVGHKRRPGSAGDSIRTPFHIAHSDDMGLQIGENGSLPATFDTWVDGDVIHVLMHELGAGVKWWQSNIADFSSSAAIKDDRGRVLSTMAGCPNVLTGLETTSDREYLLTWTETGDLAEWSGGEAEAYRLRRNVNLSSAVLAADTVQRGKSLLALRENAVDLVRAADQKGTYTKEHSLNSSHRLRMLRLDQRTSCADESYLIYSSIGQVCFVEVNPNRSDWQSKEPTLAISKPTDLVTLLSTQDGPLVNTTIVLHPRKVGWVRVVAALTNGSLLRQDISIARLRDSSCKQSEEQALLFNIDFQSSQLDASADCAALLATTRQSILIADLKNGYVEHHQDLSAKATSVVLAHSAYDDFATTQPGILAIACTDGVDILARSRYSYGQARQWMNVKRVSMKGTDLSVGAVAWLPGGRLAVSAGCSILLTDNSVLAQDLAHTTRQALEISEEQSTTVLQLLESISGPVVCWHPGLLRALTSLGYFDVVVVVLQQLQQRLRFYTNGDKLDAMLDLDIDSLLKHNKKVLSNEDELTELIDQLSELDLPFTSDKDQGKLMQIVRTVMYVLRHEESLDNNAIKYLFEWRYRVLLESERKATANGAPVNRTDQDSVKQVPNMEWRETTFAYHSNTQQPLLEVLIQYYENKLDWVTVRRLGIALWLHTVKAAQSEGAAMASLEQIFDALGQNAYRASQPPNPADSSLFLLALRKKAVLLSLWRVAVGNREQKSTSNFLKRDFNAEENRVAARKNAYALMGKRRFEYAAAFFLLADDVLSAISLLAGQCDDLPLALAVARAYCGDDSRILHQFIQDRVVVTARKTGDRWMLHWAYHISGQYDGAAQALVGTFDQEDSAFARSWQQDDPATLIMYRDLRDATSQAVGVKLPKIKVSSTEEHRAVLRSARILRRQGFWTLALRLVSHWQFKASSEVGGSGKPTSLAALGVTSEAHGNDVPNLLDSFDLTTNTSSLSTKASDIAAEPPPEKAVIATADPAKDRAAKAAELLAKMRARKADNASGVSSATAEPARKEPTQFKEPTASSLLDNFGF